MRNPADKCQAAARSQSSSQPHLNNSSRKKILLVATCRHAKPRTADRYRQQTDFRQEESVL
eukprot:752012-Hanusia_phi.AAC.3